jgi:hypothetical protein
VWPKERAGEWVETEMACVGLANTVFGQGATVPRLVSNAGLVRVMAETPAHLQLLQGRCDDRECSRIVGECSLTIKVEAQGDVE